MPESYFNSIANIKSKELFETIPITSNIPPQANPIHRLNVLKIAWVAPPTQTVVSA